MAEIVVPWTALTLALFALVDWDESRIPPASLRRAWPPASRTLALVYFGLLSVPVHFWRTRRSALGLLEGLAWAAGAFGVDWAVSEVVDALPEGALGAAMAVSVAGFTGAMLWRTRRMRGPYGGRQA